MAITLLGAATAVSAVASIYGALKGPPKYKSTPPPPPPSYYYYDAEGNPAGEQVWDPERNGYVTRAAPLSEAEKIELGKRGEIRNRLLNNLSEAPEDRQRAYQDYEDTYKTMLQRDIGETFEKRGRAREEEMSTRGMTGSRAYVDIISELEKSRTEADIQAGETAKLAGEDLAGRDRSQWMDLLGQLDTGRSAREMEEMQRSAQLRQGTQQGAGYLFDRDRLLREDEAARFGQKTGAYESKLGLGSGLTSGLMYLYGGQLGRKTGPTSTTGGGSKVLPR